jgi:hypothetical protein
MSPISISSLFREAYQLYKENANVCVIYFLILLGFVLISIVPFVGNIITIFASGAINIGLAIYIHRKLTDGAGKTEYLFDGFKNNFLKITSIQVIISIVLLSIISTVLISIVGEENIQLMIKGSKKGMIDQSVIEPFKGEFMKAMGIVFALMVILGPLLTYSTYFAYFKNQGILESMNSSIQFGFQNILSIGIIMLLMISASVLSMFACFTPMVFILPFFMIVFYLLFRYKALGVEQKDQTIG